MSAGSRHLVGVWNPTYDADAMDAHVSILLRCARELTNSELLAMRTWQKWSKPLVKGPHVTFRISFGLQYREWFIQPELMQEDERCAGEEEPLAAGWVELGNQLSQRRSGRAGRLRRLTLRTYKSELGEVSGSHSLRKALKNLPSAQTLNGRNSSPSHSPDSATGWPPLSAMSLQP